MREWISSEYAGSLGALAFCEVVSVPEGYGTAAALRAVASRITSSPRLVVLSGDLLAAVPVGALVAQVRGPRGGGGGLGAEGAGLAVGVGVGVGVGAEVAQGRGMGRRCGGCGLGGVVHVTPKVLRRAGLEGGRDWLCLSDWVRASTLRGTMRGACQEGKSAVSGRRAVAGLLAGWQH